MRVVLWAAVLLVVMPGGKSHAYPVYADYDRELREAQPRADGKLHVDTPALVARLVELHVTTYAFLVLHSSTDYDDLANEFLPAAEQAGLEVWGYLVPPTEAPADYPPCQQDYVCWATKLGQLAQAHPALKAVVMDDFDGNTSTFTPAYLKQMMDAAHLSAPSLQFLAIDYYPNALGDLLANDYQGLVDGIVFPYRDLDSTAQLQAQILEISNVVKHPYSGLTLSVPGSTSSSPGDFLALTKTATVTGGTAHIAFSLLDSYGGPTAGYHFFQLLVGGAVVYERDAALGGLQENLDLDVSAAVTGQTAVPVTLRIYDKKGVGNFPLKMVVSNLHETGLDLGSGPWTESRNNAATWSSELTTRDYHGRCVLMVYAAATSWHAAPPTTQYITSALSVGHDQVLAGTLDGVITYVLDKYSNSADFPAVAALYEAWTAAMDAGMPDASAALDAGMPDASAPDSAVPGDASMADAAVIAGDAGGSTPGNGKAGCGCGATPSEGASVAVAALLLGLTRRWRPRQRRADREDVDGP